MSEPAAITIRGVPRAVSRGQVLEALGVLGIDPSDAVSIHMDSSAVHVEVYADGRPEARTEFPDRTWRWTQRDGEPATHRLTIPIVDKDAAT